MPLLLIGIIAVVSLLFLASLALAVMRQTRNAREDGPWPTQDGMHVLATITDIQIRQGWKEGDRWERSLWDGSLIRQKTWQTYYEVTAYWMHAQTKQSYIFCSKVWSDEVAKTPTTGQTVVFIVDLRHPQRYAVDWQSLS